MTARQTDSLIEKWFLCTSLQRQATQIWGYNAHPAKVIYTMCKEYIFALVYYLVHQQCGFKSGICRVHQPLGQTKYLCSPFPPCQPELWSIEGILGGMVQEQKWKPIYMLISKWKRYYLTEYWRNNSILIFHLHWRMTCTHHLKCLWKKREKKNDSSTVI